MGLTIYQVDAFTDRPFAGNPAAVCFPPETRGEDWMRDVAREMNLSETAFLRLRDDGSYGLRWFTPAVEVEMCGHATLASAHVLAETGRLLSGETARFHTLSGLLTARKEGDLIELNFPATPAEPCDAPEGLVGALGAEPIFIGQTRFDFLVELASEADVRGLEPDFTALKRLGVRGVIATAPSEAPAFQFVSRFFAPGAGIDEDPVTGSAHCALAPFWGRRLGLEEMTGYQASARGGVVRVRLEGERVALGGHAVTVLVAELVA